MNIVRWEPFSDVVGLRRTMDRLLEEEFANPYRALGVMEKHEAIPLDVYQNANEVVVKASLPGIKSEDVEISITGDTLTIKGEAKEEKEIKKEDYFCQEQSYGTFSRSVVLPADLKFDDIEATLEDWVLTLSIPRAEEKKPRTIKIKTKKAKEIVEAQ